MPSWSLAFRKKLNLMAMRLELGNQRKGPHAGAWGLSTKKPLPLGIDELGLHLLQAFWSRMGCVIPSETFRAYLSVINSHPNKTDSVLKTESVFSNRSRGYQPNAVELRFSSSFRQSLPRSGIVGGAPEPRLQGWQGLEASMQSGYMRDNPCPSPYGQQSCANRLSCRFVRRSMPE